MRTGRSSIGFKYCERIRASRSSYLSSAATFLRPKRQNHQDQDLLSRQMTRLLPVPNKNLLKMKVNIPWSGVTFSRARRKLSLIIDRNMLRQMNTTNKMNRAKARGPRTADAPINSLVSNFIRLISKSIWAVPRRVAHEAIFETKRR